MLCLSDLAPVGWLSVEFEDFDAVNEPGFVGLFLEAEPGFYHQPGFVVHRDVTIFFEDDGGKQSSRGGWR